MPLVLYDDEYYLNSDRSFTDARTDAAEICEEHFEIASHAVTRKGIER